MVPWKKKASKTTVISSTSETALLFQVHRIHPPLLLERKPVD
jgi:hypothetical protein